MKVYEVEKGGMGKIFKRHSCGNVATDWILEGRKYPVGYNESNTCHTSVLYLSLTSPFTKVL